MVDVTVNGDDWRTLRRRTLFFLPRLGKEDIATPINRAEFISVSRELARSANDNQLSLSQSSIAAILTRQPLGVRKCQSAVRCFNLIAERKGDDRRIEEGEIVASVFCAYNLSETLASHGFEPIELASIAGFNQAETEVFHQMIARKRVPLYVGLRIARVLSDTLEDFQFREFLTTRLDSAPFEVPQTDDGKSILTSNDLVPASLVVSGEWLDWSEKERLPVGMP